MDLARSHALFAGLDEATLRALAAEVRVVELAGQQVLWRRGDAADGFCCVLRGLLHEGDQALGPGDTLGERALIAGTPHATTVLAARDSTLLHVSAAGFQRLWPLVGLQLARGLVAQRPRGVRRIAVVPVGPVEGFVEELLACLRAAGIEVGGPADLVLVVAAGDAAPQAPPPGVPAELVLVRRQGLPSGTAAWLGGYRRHHHALAGRKGEAERVARLLGGRAVGLALSGGSSRATAYVGVFKALAECGIAPDVVAGTSGGAMLGAMYALGWDADRMLEQIHVLDRTPFYRDLGPPLVSLLGGKGMSRVLLGFFGASRLEDLPIRLLPVCASLRHSRVVVPAEGPLWQAVRASCALPGVFPPVPWEGDLLVDGGLLNNLPADLLVESCWQGRLLAADVQAPFPAADPLEVSGWRTLWRRQPVSILDILQQSASLASNAHREQTLRHVHLLIEPPAAKGLEAMVEAGYRAAMSALEAAGLRAVTST